MRRTWLRGRENVHKGDNLGILMRLLIGAGTPREAAARALVFVLFIYADHAAPIILVAASHNGRTVLLVTVWR